MPWKTGPGSNCWLSRHWLSMRFHYGLSEANNGLMSMLAGTWPANYGPEKGAKRRLKPFILFHLMGGTMIHDCCSSHFSCDHGDHGLCGSHLLRELVFVIARNGYPWVYNMKRLLGKVVQKFLPQRRSSWLIRNWPICTKVTGTVSLVVWKSCRLLRSDLAGNEAG